MGQMMLIDEDELMKLKRKEEYFNRLYGVIDQIEKCYPELHNYCWDIELDDLDRKEGVLYKVLRYFVKKKRKVIRKYIKDNMGNGEYWKSYINYFRVKKDLDDVCTTDTINGAGVSYMWNYDDINGDFKVQI